MPAIIAILIALGAGIFIGRHLEGARESHEHFNSYRARTMKGFNDWVKNTIIVGAGIAVFIIGFYLLLFNLHIR
jgi:VanZ family protein